MQFLLMSRTIQLLYSTNGGTVPQFEKHCCRRSWNGWTLYCVAQWETAKRFVWHNWRRQSVLCDTMGDSKAFCATQWETAKRFVWHNGRRQSVLCDTMGDSKAFCVTQWETAKRFVWHNVRQQSILWHNGRQQQSVLCDTMGDTSKAFYLSDKMAGTWNRLVISQ